MSARIPEYRHHKPSGQALVQIRSRRTYLGKYGSEESKEKFRRLIAEQVCGDGEAATDVPLDEMTVNEVIVGCFE